MKATTIFLSTLFCAAALSAPSCSAAKQPTASATPAERLISRLKAVEASGKTIFGHDDDPVYGVDWNLDEGRSDVRDVVGDYPGMMHWDLGMIEMDSPVNLDSVPFDRMRAEMLAQHARGGVNGLSWHPRNPSDPSKDSWQAVDKDVVKLTVTPGTPENATMQKWLGRVADYLASLTDPAGNRVPVIFRPWHEMSGGWFWWGDKNTTTDSYRQLWKMTREAFDARGLDNVVWAYSPDAVREADKYLNWYPGDDMVDIFGADIYHFNGAEGRDNWLALVDTAYGAAEAAARARGKIAALTETGCESLVVADWYTSCLLPVIRKYRPAYVTVWRNARRSVNPKHFYVPYPGHPAEESFRTFYRDPQTLFARDLKAYN